MRIALFSGCAGAFSPLLPSHCLRYGVALPSVWLRMRLSKLRQLNNFRSDYPLILNWFWPPFWDVRETTLLRRFLVLRSGSFHRSVATQLKLHRLADVVGRPSNSLAYCSLAREAFAKQCVPEYARQLFSVPCLQHIAPRNCSLKRHRKSCLAPPRTFLLNSRYLVVQVGTSVCGPSYVSQPEVRQPFRLLFLNDDRRTERIAPRLERRVCSSHCACWYVNHQS